MSPTLMGIVFYTFHIFWHILASEYYVLFKSVHGKFILLIQYYINICEVMLKYNDLLALARSRVFVWSCHCTHWMEQTSVPVSLQRRGGIQIKPERHHYDTHISQRKSMLGDQQTDQGWRMDDRRMDGGWMIGMRLKDEWQEEWVNLEVRMG